MVVPNNMEIGTLIADLRESSSDGLSLNLASAVPPKSMSAIDS